MKPAIGPLATVQELIDALEKIEDKQKRIAIYDWGWRIGTVTIQEMAENKHGEEVLVIDRMIQ